MGARAVDRALLALTVPLVTLLAIRVYRAGVVMYGQPPSPRTFWRAIRGRLTASVEVAAAEPPEHGQDRRGGPCRATLRLGRHAIRAGVPRPHRDRPPQPAPDAGQVRAGAAHARACPRSPGPRPPRRAPGPRPRSPAPRRRRRRRPLTLRSSARRVSSGLPRQPRAVVVQQVEHEQRDGPPGPSRETRLERRRVRPSAPVDGDELAVEHRGPRRHQPAQPGELREPRPPGLRRSRPRPACRAARLEEHEHAVAAPRGLEQVVGRVERVRDAAPATSAPRRSRGAARGRARGRAGRPSRAMVVGAATTTRCAGLDLPAMLPPARPRPAPPACPHPEDPVPRPAQPDDLYRLARPDRPAPLAGRPLTVAFTVSAVGRRQGRLPARRSGCAPADGSGAGPPADARPPLRRPPPVLARTAGRWRSSRTAGSMVEEEPERRRTPRTARTACRSTCCRSTAARRAASRTCRAA